MTNKIKELVAAGHALAKELHCAEPAALVRELATQLDVQLARSNALAAENAGLKSACERVSMWNDFPQVTLRSTGEVVPYVVAYGSNGERDYMRNIAIAALKDTPSTDAFLAEVRAQGVEMFAAHKRERQQALRSRSMRMSEESAGMAADAENFAAQIRKGVQS